MQYLLATTDLESYSPSKWAPRHSFHAENVVPGHSSGPKRHVQALRQAVVYLMVGIDFNLKVTPMAVTLEDK